MVKDVSDRNDTGEMRECEASQDGSPRRYTDKLVRAVQGYPDDAEVADNASAKGAAFQEWADQHVFAESILHGKGNRLTLRPEDNSHLDKLGDGVGISKAYRQSDSYIDDYGEIYELKAGYRSGGIDEQQAYEYSLMQEAGKVYTRREDGQVVEVPVKGVTYIFDSEEGARANRSILSEYGFGILYLDKEKKLQQLKEE